MARPTEYGPLALIAPELREIAAERDWRELRRERLLALINGGRKDSLLAIEEESYQDGIRYGLDLALLILHHDRPS